MQEAAPTSRRQVSDTQLLRLREAMFLLSRSLFSPFCLCHLEVPKTPTELRARKRHVDLPNRKRQQSRARILSALRVQQNVSSLISTARCNKLFLFQTLRLKRKSRCPAVPIQALKSQSRLQSESSYRPLASQSESHGFFLKPYQSRERAILDATDTPQAPQSCRSNQHRFALAVPVFDSIPPIAHSPSAISTGYPDPTVKSSRLPRNRAQGSESHFGTTACGFGLPDCQHRNCMRCENHPVRRLRPDRHHSRNRTPGPPPLASRNSTPAFSKADLIAARFAGIGVLRSSSKLLTVLTLTPEASASAGRLHLSSPRAARHWEGVITRRYFP